MCKKKICPTSVEHNLDHLPPGFTTRFQLRKPDVFSNLRTQASPGKLNKLVLKCSGDGSCSLRASTDTPPLVFSKRFFLDDGVAQLHIGTTHGF